jgi:hypothetical protein
VLCGLLLLRPRQIVLRQWEIRVETNGFLFGANPLVPLVHGVVRGSNIVPCRCTAGPQIESLVGRFNAARIVAGLV